MKKHKKTVGAELGVRFFELQRLRTLVEEAEKRRATELCGGLLKAPPDHHRDELSDVECTQQTLSTVQTRRD
jgi:hypothetical protein